MPRTRPHYRKPIAKKIKYHPARMTARLSDKYNRTYSSQETDDDTANLVTPATHVDEEAMETQTLVEIIDVDFEDFDLKDEDLGSPTAEE